MTWGTGPRTSRKSTRSGRANRTVSTVWATRPSRPTQWGEMGRQHHVAAPFQHPELVGQRPWRSAEVGLGDHVEDHPTEGGHVDQLGAKGTNPPADAKIQRAGIGHQ